MIKRSPRSPASSKNPLKGLHKVRKPGRTGEFYYYAWRNGGPRIDEEYGSDEFLACFLRAREEHKAPDKTRFRGVVTDYKASSDFTGLALSTKKKWETWLDEIIDTFGDLQVRAFDHTKEIKRAIRKWRDRRADRARSADYGMQVLSRVLSFAVEQGDLNTNACTGFRPLYSSDRSEIIWTDADIAQVKSVASKELGWAIDLAAHTGLRAGDLVRLSWSHVGEDIIEIPTGKSRGRKSAIIPLYDALRAVLGRIERRSPVVLTNALKHRPWTRDGLGTMFHNAKVDAKMGGRGLHFHDLRGTAVTKFYLDGLAIREIAEIMAWEESQVERIIKKYVSGNAATKALIEKLNRAKQERNV